MKLRFNERRLTRLSRRSTRCGISRAGSQAEFNWDMGARQVCSAQGRRRFFPTWGKDIALSSTSRRHPAVVRGYLKPFFPPSVPRITLDTFGPDKVRLICGSHVSDDPDVERTSAHDDERRIISPAVSLCGYTPRDVLIIVLRAVG